MHQIHNVEDLIAFEDKHGKYPYILFWGHKEYKNKVSHACFSQWYSASFEENGRVYKTAEHYMMVKKAELFGDNDMLLEILAAPDPATAQLLGRKVQNFDQDIWNEHKNQIVVNGNFLKFSQNPKLKEYILSTKEKILVEATLADNIWGIGYAPWDEEARDPKQWKGENRLGFCLMRVRNQLTPVEKAKEEPMENCRVCGSKTNSVYNINLKAAPICHSCGSRIFLQHAQWLVENDKELKNGV